MAGVISQPVAAQDGLGDAGPKRTIAIVPRVSVTETLTDNVRLSAVGQSEQITEISPGIRIVGEGARVKGYFDYAINGRMYAQNTSGANLQSALTTFGTVEAVSNWAFVDFSGSISQQAISALGTQSGSSANLNSNSTQSSTYRLSPYLRGQLANVANYEARYSVASTRSTSGFVSDAMTRDALVNLSGRGNGSRLGWSVALGRQSIGYGTGRVTESGSLTGQLLYAIQPKLNLSITAGQESNNYTSVDTQTYGTSGLGITWAPSEATTFSASRQTHSYGQSHTLSFDHRTTRTAWRFSDSQSVTATPSQPGSTNLGSAYDLYFAQFASVEPDLVKRAALVSNFLQANGISPATSVVSGFLTSAVSLQRRQDLSFTLLGVRDTVTFLASRSENSRLDTVTGVTDDLSNASLIRQGGLSISYAHRLTPNAAMNILAAVQQSSSSSPTAGLQETNSKSINLSVSTKVGLRSSAVLSARHVVFDSTTTPYTESAISGTFNLQF